MSGSNLRRLVPVVVLILLLVPLASASAATAQRSDWTLRLTDWSHTLLRPMVEVLHWLRFSADEDAPPGPPPGGDPNPNPNNREGSGLDPHGKP